MWLPWSLCAYMYSVADMSRRVSHCHAQVVDTKTIAAAFGSSISLDALADMLEYGLECFGDTKESDSSVHVFASFMDKADAAAVVKVILCMSAWLPAGSKSWLFAQ